MILTSEAIAELKAKAPAGEIFYMHFKEADQTVCFRRPSYGEYALYQGSVADKTSKLVDAGRELATAIALYPPPAEMSAFLDRYPGCASRIAVEASKVAAARELEDARKA